MVVVVAAVAVAVVIPVPSVFDAVHWVSGTESSIL